MSSLDKVMRQMHWKPGYRSTAKCVWRGCDNPKANAGGTAVFVAQNPRGRTAD